MLGKLIPFIVLFLLACGADDYEPVEIGSMDEAVRVGLIMDFGRAEVVATTPRLIPVYYEARTETRNMTFDVEFFRHYALTFEEEYRVFRQFYVLEGDMVSEGTLLASGLYEASEVSLAQHRRMVNDLRRMEDDFPIERVRRQIEIMDLEMEVETATAAERERAIIDLAIRELQYEQFVTQTTRAIENARKRVADAERHFAVEYIVAPFDGLVTFTAPMREGMDVNEGRTIVAVADVDTVFFNVQFQETHVFRYGDVFPVNLAGEEIYVRVSNDPFAAGFRGWWVTNYILRPLSNEGIENALQRMDGDWARLRRQYERRAFPAINMYSDAIWLPHTAIHSTTVMRLELEVVLNYVNIYEDGAYRQRFVTLGPYRHNNHQHILSGVESGQKVVGVQ
ncbi:MAG: efflux RND transporter periplasmic adaptor subunit [Defluviitaleaceae bacterium]|nr:efflux RND transporter periplasmic adaptor subunit [Defluviitaleaceae bacterium]